VFLFPETAMLNCTNLL